jgi:hypothetical protein
MDSHKYTDLIKLSRFFNFSVREIERVYDNYDGDYDATFQALTMFYETMPPNTVAFTLPDNPIQCQHSGETVFPDLDKEATKTKEEIETLERLYNMPAKERV